MGSGFGTANWGKTWGAVWTAVLGGWEVSSPDRMQQHQIRGQHPQRRVHKIYKHELTAKQVYIVDSGLRSHLS
jgi:hypothetical protein